jgi:hypothetical protein
MLGSVPKQQIFITYSSGDPEVQDQTPASLVSGGVWCLLLRWCLLTVSPHGQRKKGQASYPHITGE